MNNLICLGMWYPWGTDKREDLIVSVLGSIFCSSNHTEFKLFVLNLNKAKQKKREIMLIFTASQKNPFGNLQKGEIFPSPEKIL